VVDLLVEVDSWIALSDCFTYAAGGGGKRASHFLQSLYACILAQAEKFARFAI
jgi:hypothetical protein